MTISEIKRQLEGLTKAQREQKAIAAIEAFTNEVEPVLKIYAQYGIDVQSLRDIPSLFFGGAIAMHESFGLSEYNTYSRFCASAKLSARPYGECQGLHTGASHMLNLATTTVDSMKDIYGRAGKQDVFEKLAFPIACLMYGDNGFTDNGIQYLSLFANNDIGGGVVNGKFGHVAVNKPQDVELVQHNATITQTDGGYYFSVGAELKNPNKAYTAQDVNIRIIVKDARGKILATNDNMLLFIDSNATAYYGEELWIDRGTPSSYTVQVNTENYIPSSDPEDNVALANAISCSNYSVDTNSWGSTVFSGEVRNRINKKLHVDLYFVFFDSAQRITGGTNTTMWLYGNSTDAFEIYLRTKAQRQSVRFTPSFDFTDMLD